MQKISVIVPVYNGEDSIRKCIASITGQTYKDLEIIIIDDGSKDNTQSICQEIAEKDNRLKVFYQENHGVSAARNNGLNHISGEYVMFVDADDFLDTDACQKCIDTINLDNSDIVVANKIFHIGNRVQKNVLYSNRHFSREGEDKELFILDLMTPYFDKTMNKVAYLSCGVTAKLFKTDLILSNGIKFREDCRFGEDVLFNMECFQQAKSITYIDYDVYHFCVNSGSSTHKFRNDWNKSHEVFMDGIDLFNAKYKKDNRFLQAAEMMKVSRISSLAVSYYFHKDNPNSFLRSYAEFQEFMKSPKYARAIQNVNNQILTDNQKKIVFFLRHHMTMLFAGICYIRNRVRKV